MAARHRRLLVAGVAAAIVVSGVAVAVASGGHGSGGVVEVRGAPTTGGSVLHLSTTTPSSSTTTSTAAPVALGPTEPSPTAPPPWSAEPTTGLVNLQAVTITAHGLPNGNYVVGQCPSDVVVPDLNRCVTNGRPAFVTVDDGTLLNTVHVYRQLHNFDCAGAPGACVVGFMNGVTKANFAPVAFPISFDPARPPHITVSPSDGLTDGQTVEVRGVDVGYGLVRVGQCLRASIGCVTHEAIAAPDGSFSLSFPVARDLTIAGRYPAGTGHCGVDDECEIVVSVLHAGSNAYSWSDWATPIASHFAPIPNTSTTVDATTSTTAQ